MYVHIFVLQLRENGSFKNDREVVRASKRRETPGRNSEESKFPKVVEAGALSQVGCFHVLVLRVSLELGFERADEPEGVDLIHEANEPEGADGGGHEEAHEIEEDAEDEESERDHVPLVDLPKVTLQQKWSLSMDYGLLCERTR